MQKVVGSNPIARSRVCEVENELQADSEKKIFLQMSGKARYPRG